MRIFESLLQYLSLWIVSGYGNKLIALLSSIGVYFDSNLYGPCHVIQNIFVSYAHYIQKNTTLMSTAAQDPQTHLWMLFRVCACVLWSVCLYVCLCALLCSCLCVCVCVCVCVCLGELKDEIHKACTPQLISYTFSSSVQCLHSISTITRLLLMCRPV